MDQLLTAILGSSAISSLRQDETVARQGVMNHQTASHLMDLSFINAQTEMSIPESYAVQGLSLSNLPAQTAGMNTAVRTPQVGN